LTEWLTDTLGEFRAWALRPPARQESKHRSQGRRVRNWPAGAVARNGTWVGPWDASAHGSPAEIGRRHAARRPECSAEVLCIASDGLWGRRAWRRANRGVI